jgi:hypothetical protein
MRHIAEGALARTKDGGILGGRCAIDRADGLPGRALTKHGGVRAPSGPRGPLKFRQQRKGPWRTSAASARRGDAADVLL